MSIRIRKVDGITIALCAAETDPKPGDIYLDDAMHHALNTKFGLDWLSEELIQNPPVDPVLVDLMAKEKLRDAETELKDWQKTQLPNRDRELELELESWIGVAKRSISFQGKMSEIWKEFQKTHVEGAQGWHISSQDYMGIAKMALCYAPLEENPSPSSYVKQAKALMGNDVEALNEMKITLLGIPVVSWNAPETRLV